jgi:hypothetical protein
MYSFTLSCTSTLVGVGDQRHSLVALPQKRDSVHILQLHLRHILKSKKRKVFDLKMYINCLYNDRHGTVIYFENKFLDLYVRVTFNIIHSVAVHNIGICQAI